MVHCSAGVGRTGTFITIRHELERAIQIFRSEFASYFQLSSVDDKISAIQHFLQNHEFNIVNTVLGIRRDRKMMVQREEQLQFCYDFFTFLSDSANSGHQCMEEYVLPLFFPGSQSQCGTEVQTYRPLFTFP